MLRYVINISCILFQGAASHYKYARELLFYIYLTSSDAATLELQRAVLSNSLVNTQGQRDSFFKKDRRLEHHNGLLKELNTHKRTSSLFPESLLKKYALLAPSFRVFSRKLETAYGPKANDNHAFKNAAEDIFSHACHLCTTSLRRNKGAVSKHPARNLCP